MLQTTDGISQGRSTVVPAHSSRKLPPLCGITGSHPHRNVKVVRLQWQAKKKNKEVCTCFDCHCSAVEICDCSAKYNYDFFVRWGREFCASPGTGLLLQEGAPARITVRHHEGARVLAEGERDCSQARGEPARGLCQAALDSPPALPWRSVGRGTLSKQLCPSEMVTVSQKILGRGVNRRQCCPTEEKKEASVRQNILFSKF